MKLFLIEEIFCNDTVYYVLYANSEKEAITKYIEENHNGFKPEYPTKVLARELDATHPCFIVSLENLNL